jgi:GAF domain-containing protein
LDALLKQGFLHRLALTAASTLEAEHLMRLVIAKTTEAMATEVCSIYLVDEGGDHLVLTATNGLSQSAVGRTRLRIGEGVTGWAARERAPLTVADVRAEPRFAWVEGVDEERFVSMCSVPMVSSGRLVGVLNVQSERERHFGGDEVAFLAAIAAQVAGAVERSAIQRRLEERLTELRRAEDLLRRLSELALAGAGPDPICAAIAGHAGAPVALYDEGGERLAGADPRLPPRLDLDEGAPGRERLAVLPVRAEGRLLGWLAAGAAEGAGAPGRWRALEHGATVLALELMRERAVAEAGRRRRADLLEEFLSAGLEPAEALRQGRGEAQRGRRVQGPAWVLALAPDDADTAAALQESALRRRAVWVLLALARRHHPRAQVVDRGSAIAIVVPGEARTRQTDALRRAAADGLRRVVPDASIATAVSSWGGELLDVDRLADEAGHALRSAQQVAAPAALPTPLPAAPAGAQCATCWGQRRIWEKGTLGLVPVVCGDCRGRGLVV